MAEARFDHILSVNNSRSTQAADSKRYLAAIMQACPEADTKSVPLNELLPGSLRAIKPGSLICVSGGDGSVNGVVQALLETPALTGEQRRTPVLPLWCGNANDIAHMLNGRASAAKCKTILTKGNIVPVYPLRCELLAPESSEATVRLATGYLSLGVSAQTAQRLNEPSFRQNPLHAVPGVKPVSEMLLLLHAMLTSPSFTVEQDGRQKTVYDWIIGKGPRMAKNVKLPVQLTDRAYYQSVVRKNLPEVAARLSGMAWGDVKTGAKCRTDNFYNPATRMGAVRRRTHAASRWHKSNRLAKPAAVLRAKHNLARTCHSNLNTKPTS